MDTPLLALRDIRETPLHKVLSRFEYLAWYRKGAVSGIAMAVPDCVQLLVQYKADLNLVDAWDRTPLQVVLQHRRAGACLNRGREAVVMTLAERCVEIMGAEAKATMPSRKAEAATDLRYPMCQVCMVDLRSLEHRNLRQIACDACYWKGFAVWCALCQAWRPLRAESEAAAKTCPQCQVLQQPSRYFCQSCGDRPARCQCPKEDRDKLAHPVEIVTHLSSGAVHTGGASSSSAASSQRPMPAATPATEAFTELQQRRNAALFTDATPDTAAADADMKLKGKCFRCKQPLVDCGSLRDKDYAYCSDECRYPVCSGRAANGKPCRQPRAHTGAYRSQPPRFDQERTWFCRSCFKKGDNRKYATGEHD